MNDQLEAYFKARPGIWIDGRDLAEVAGNYAWRTRCSDLRKRGLNIENRIRKVDRHNGVDRYAVSEYRYVSDPPAVPAETHDLNVWGLS